MSRGAEVRHTVCRACHAQCALLVQMQDGAPVKLYGDKDNPIYHGFSCIKGRELATYHREPTRLLHSLKRRADGGHAPIASQVMMDEIAAKVAALVAEHGPRSVALYVGTHGYNNFSAKFFAEAFFAAIGSKMVFTSVTIDQPGKAISAMLHGLWLAGTPAMETWDVLTLIGTNPLVSMNGGLGMNPAKRLHAAKKRGMKLVVIDPRRTDCAEQADLHIAPRPGQDVPVLAAIARLLIERGQFDRAFVAAEADGLDALTAALAPYTVEMAAERADVDPALILQAADIIGAARRGAFSAGTGVNMSGRGNLVEYFVKVLTTLKGFWRREGEALLNPGVCINPFPAIAASPGPMPATGGGEVLRVRGLKESTAGMPTAGLAEEILTPGEGQVKALFVLGGNPVLAWPDQILTVQAMKALELLVCFDPHLSATARHAHYVAAPTLPLEVMSSTSLNEMIGNFGPGWGFHAPYSQWAEPLTAPPQDADVQEEWQVFHGLAARLGLPLTVKTSAWLDPAQAAADATVVEPGQPLDSREVWRMLLRGAPVPADEIMTATEGKVFDRPQVVVQPTPEGWATRLDIGSPTLMAELGEIADETPVEGPYPLRLISRRLKEVLNSCWHENGAAQRRWPYNPAFMNPADMAAYHLADGDVVEIESGRAAIRGVVASAPDVRRGCISMTHAWGAEPGLEDAADPLVAGANTGRLTAIDQDFDARTGIPLMSAIPVRVRACVTPA
jgi:anaerobic selenocysteine-containing dehydrogenase